MRLVRAYSFFAFFVTLAAAIQLRADSREDLETKLRSEYQNHIITLRKFYLGKRLTFDSSGQLIGAAKTDSWTVASQMHVSSLRLLDDGVEFRGERVFLAAESSNNFKSLFPIGTKWDGVDASWFEDTDRKIKSKKLTNARDLTVRVQLTPEMMNEKALHVSLSAILLAPSESLSSIVDPCWKEYLNHMNPQNTEAGSDRVFSAKDGVSAPRPLETPDPHYSEWAKQAGYEGTDVLKLIVDHTGRTKDIRITRPLGLGLDERAVEAVSTWRFKPAQKDNQPVDVRIVVEVTFRLY